MVGYKILLSPTPLRKYTFSTLWGPCEGSFQGSLLSESRCPHPSLGLWDLLTPPKSLTDHFLACALRQPGPPTTQKQFLTKMEKVHLGGGGVKRGGDNMKKGAYRITVNQQRFRCEIGNSCGLSLL
jgi:hypothetical protein